MALLHHTLKSLIMLVALAGAAICMPKDDAEDVLSEKMSMPKQSEMCSADDLTAEEELELFPAPAEGQPECYITTIPSTTCSGLANQIWRFASLYAIGRAHGRRPAMFEKLFLQCERRFNSPGEIEALFPVYWRNIRQIKAHAKYLDDREMMRKIEVCVETEFLSEIFDFESYALHKNDIVEFPNFSQSKCCIYDDPSRLNLDSVDARVVVLGDWHGSFLQNHNYHHALRPQIRKIFGFGGAICSSVSQYASTLFGADTESHKLCVHTRKGDFHQFGFESTAEFTERSAEKVALLLRKQLGGVSVSVVLLGEDRDFLNSLHIDRKLVPHLYVPEAMPRAEDFVFGVTQCDSLVITAPESTFSWWMGYLMPDGARVFHSIDFHPREQWHTVDNFLPEWTPLTQNEALAAQNGKVILI